MTLPPEQINIKRRREEEPVETLYIQSALHQTKRRFTDFVFQRVTIRSNGTPDDSDSSTPPHPAAQRLLRSPRSVSSLQIPNRRAAAAAERAKSSNGVPQVRATSPGAEIRQAQRLAAEKKEAEEKRQRALQGPPTAQNDSPAITGTGATTNTDKTEIPGSNNVPPSASHLQSVRRFQISRSSDSILGPRHGLTGGIKKRRGAGSAGGVAVLVEQLQRKPHSRQASVIADLVHQAQFDSQATSVQAPEETEAPAKPRKRPVVNQAEKKWREERQRDISAAKQHLSDTLEKSAQAHHSTWDEESERLAEEFQRVALEIEREMEVDPEHLDDRFAPPTSRPQIPITSPQPLKYQPRPPKKPRAPPAQQPPASAPTKPEDTSSLANVNEDENDYVYDVYIRRPLEEVALLANPLADAEADQQLKNLETPTSGIGVIVITEEDEEYWENFVEDDEEEWDSEDADSNAENNPANDYPEEELSCSDEEDDPSAIYRKYRYRAASDDEEYGYDESGSENGQYGARFDQWRSSNEVDSDSD